MAAVKLKTSPVSVGRFFESGEELLKLKVIAGQSGMTKRIGEPALNRCGLGLTGFFEYFANRRIQVVGLAEHTYLSSLDKAERILRVKHMFDQKIPCLVVSRGKQLFPELLELADARKIPLLRTSLVTKDFVNAATILMENLQAPRTKVQGTMLEIMGVGVLIEGKSGLGKSETALSLIRNGYSLVADDITSLRRDSSGVVIGSAVEVTKYHMEIRGLGIVHVPSLFGISAVREQKSLDLVVTFTRPGSDSKERRVGNADATCERLGVTIPHVVVTVEAGRNLANVVEAAALNQKLKRLGHDAEKELDARLVSILSQSGSVD